jgi:FkbH-like protein
METRTQYECEVFINTFIGPSVRLFGNYDLKVDTESSLVNRLNLDLSQWAPAYLHFCDWEFISSQVGRLKWKNNRLYDLAKVPCDFPYQDMAAQLFATGVGALWGKSKKCLVLDLDNTLWGGIIGDDGLSGIRIGEDSGDGEAFKRFQTYVKKLKERGVILAVCSKNDENIAREPFEKRTDMVLRATDFSCFIANWSPKSENIVTISRKLNIGLDSLVFFDDSPVEREIVRQHLPMVTVVNVPEDVSLYCVALSEGRYFDAVSFTDEDRKKTEQYLANEMREIAVTNFADYGDYLMSLNMEAIVEDFDEQNLRRITQLINKTNQFNLTTPRYTEAQVRSFMESSEVISKYVKVRDRFGDYGLIGLAIARIKGGQAFLDTFLMSCRVLKRGVEDLLIRSLLEDLINRGVGELRGSYIRTEKNKMVKDLLFQFQFAIVDANEERSSYVLKLSKSLDIFSKEIFINKISAETYGVGN